MSESSDNPQPLQDQPPAPPANAVEDEQPVAEAEIGDGYEADDEGPEGWPQDPFNDDDNMSVVTEEEAEQVEEPQSGNDNNSNN